MSKFVISKIFIVDDDRVWTSILHKMLDTLGYTRITAFESGEACLLNMNLNPDLIFLDYKMDSMDGLETLRQIKAIYPDARVVFCTASEKMELAVSALRGGSLDYLVKTKVTEESLSRLIGEVASRIRKEESETVKAAT